MIMHLLDELLVVDDTTIRSRVLDEKPEAGCIRWITVRKVIDTHLDAEMPCTPLEDRDRLRVACCINEEETLVQAGGLPAHHHRLGCSCCFIKQ